MELLIIQYSLATLITIFGISLIFRIILNIKDAPKKFGLFNKGKGKKLF